MKSERSSTARGKSRDDCVCTSRALRIQGDGLTNINRNIIADITAVTIPPRRERVVYVDWTYSSRVDRRDEHWESRGMHNISRSLVFCDGQVEHVPVEEVVLSADGWS